ncbi:MAG: sulfatase-like hydrolase/transferase, partial [Limisphaerales bacterium]
MFSSFPMGRFLIVIMGALLEWVAGAAAGPLPVPAMANQPNLIVILADDLGYGDLSCYGNKRFETPSLDQMASEGMRFTDFHSSGPVCSPTRAGLLTGRYQQRSGIPGVINAAFQANRHHGLSPEEWTFAEALQGQGYHTAIFGKWHLGYRAVFNPIHHGFEVFKGYVSGNVDYHAHIDRMGVKDWWQNDLLADETGYTTELITQHALSYLEAHAEDRFCLYLAYEAPHDPY